MKPVYIVDGARTPFLKSRNRPGPFAASDLATQAGRTVLAVESATYLDVFVGTQGRRPDADRFHHSALILHDHHVAQAERPLEEQIQPGEEVLEDVLERQTDGESDNADEGHDGAERDAERVE